MRRPLLLLVALAASGCTEVAQHSLGAHASLGDGGAEAGGSGARDAGDERDAEPAEDAAADEDAGWDRDPYHWPDGGYIIIPPECFWFPHKCPPPPRS